MFERDPRYRAVPNSSLREEWFREHTKSLWSKVGGRREGGRDPCYWARQCLAPARERGVLQGAHQVPGEQRGREGEREGGKEDNEERVGA